MGRVSRPIVTTRILPAAVALVLVLAASAHSRVGSDSTLSFAGLGEIKVGMSERQAERAGGIELTGTGSGPGCRYVAPADRSIRADFMLTNGRIVRVDVDRRGIRTTSGVRVGDSETSVRRRLAGRIRIAPHKYVVGGFYIEHIPRTRAGRNRRVLFETDGRKVTYIRAGRLPEVGWVERCA